jgi:hypothetical protein
MIAHAIDRVGSLPRWLPGLAIIILSVAVSGIVFLVFFAPEHKSFAFDKKFSQWYQIVLTDSMDSGGFAFDRVFCHSLRGGRYSCTWRATRSLCSSEVITRGRYNAVTILREQQIDCKP